MVQQPLDYRPVTYKPTTVIQTCVYFVRQTAVGYMLVDNVDVVLAFQTAVPNVFEVGYGCRAFVPLFVTVVQSVHDNVDGITYRHFLSADTVVYDVILNRVT